MRLVSLVEDLELIEMARVDAAALVGDDPHLERSEHRPLALLVEKTGGDALTWMDSG
jgi:hypothetical protein